VDGLAAAIDARLARLKVLRSLGDNRRNANATLASAKARHDHVAASHSEAAAAFAAAWAVYGTRQGGEASVEPVPPDARELQGWLDTISATAEGWASSEASLRTQANTRELLRSTHGRYALHADQRTRLDSLVPRVEAALALCVAERQAFVDGIISEIAKQVGELYEKVHPGEGLNKISLPLDTKKRASLDLVSQFSGYDAPPQAYFSQSHLDTLGLCVFLALALRESPDQTILVLDDVLGSIDEPHVDRVIDTIYEVSARFRHTIVTTHYRPWRAKFQWGELRPDQPCQFIELVGWSIGDGMRTSAPMPEVERLKVMMAASDLDTQAIAAKAGVILERVLDFLTLMYGCSVPRKLGDAFVLGDLLPSVPKKLREALIAERANATGGFLAMPLKPHFDALDGIVQARNVMGAHFNRLGDHLPPADALKFATEVVALAEAIICPDHGWPKNDKSGSYWRNSGDTRRLHPLKKPS
jgi:hypothetical protein